MKRWFGSIRLHPQHVNLRIETGALSTTSVFNADKIAEAAHFEPRKISNAETASSLQFGRKNALAYQRNHNSEQRAKAPLLHPLAPEISACLSVLDELSGKQQMLVQRLQTIQLMNTNDERWLHDFTNGLKQDSTTNGSLKEAERALIKLERLFVSSTQLKEKVEAEVQAAEVNMACVRQKLEQCIRETAYRLRQSHTAATIKETALAAPLDTEKQLRDFASVSLEQHFDELRREVEPERIAARHRLSRTKGRLEEAQRCFDRRQETYDQDVEAYQQAIQKGICESAITDFDLAHIVEGQRLKRALVEAEISHSKALSEVRRMEAANTTSSQTSRFRSQPEAGETMQKDAEQVVVAIDRSRVEDWRRAVTVWGCEHSDDHASDRSGNVTDYWDLQSLEAGQSTCGFAVGRSRQKIDHWNRQRHNDWQQTLEKASHEQMGVLPRWI